MIKITEKQKLQALAHKYYQQAQWVPKKGDYYTSTRSDLEVYQVVDVTETDVKTVVNQLDGEPSSWPKEEFLTKGFGPQRVWLPDHILFPEIAEFEPCVVENEELRFTEVLLEDRSTVSVPWDRDGVFIGHAVDLLYDMSSDDLVGVRIWDKVKHRKLFKEAKK